MPQNTDNYDLICPPKQTNNPADPNDNAVATDVHIGPTHATVEVLGVGGIDPDSPTSPHGVGIDQQGRIDITDITVQPGATLRIRLKHSKNNARLAPLTYQWTYPRGTTGNRQPQTLAALIDEQSGDDGAEAAVSDLRPLLEALLEAIGPMGVKDRKQKDR